MTTDGRTETRYAVTIVPEEGALRTLFRPAQSRYMHDTKDAAERERAEFQASVSAREVYGAALDTLRVDPVECWPGGGDPRGIYFDD